MWDIVKLSDVILETLTGEWGKECIEETSGVRVIRTTNFTNETKINYDNVVFRDIDQRKVDSKKLKFGDIILEKSGGTDKQPVGRVVYFSQESTDIYLCNNFTQILRANAEKINPKYLLYYLFYVYKQGVTSSMQNQTTGIRNLDVKKYLQMSIPLPPLSIQDKIADTLDNVIVLIDKRKEQIELMDKLAKDAFIEIFGDPITNPKDWETKALGDITKVVTGNTPPRAKSEYYGDFIDWIKSDNINTPNMYITRSAERLSEEGYKKGRFVPENSILMTCIAGSHNCIGNIAITDKEVAFNQQINAIVVGELPVFFWYMQLLLSKQKVQELSTKGMKGIVNKTKLESLIVMVPPIDLQIKFSDQLGMIEEQKSIFKTSLEELEITYRSTMQKAFNGEIFS